MPSSVAGEHESGAKGLQSVGPFAGRESGMQRSETGFTPEDCVDRDQALEGEVGLEDDGAAWPRSRGPQGSGSLFDRSIELAKAPPAMTVVDGEGVGAGRDGAGEEVGHGPQARAAPSRTP
jgi:hypothetical protein